MGARQRRSRRPVLRVRRSRGEPLLHLPQGVGEVVSVEELAGAGGYTPARRLIATRADGSTVFVKAAVDEPTTRWVRQEHAALRTLGPQRFAPALLGGDDEAAIVVLEDLRHGWWPTPWRPGDVARVLAVLDEVAATLAPPSATAASSMRGGLRRWAALADDLPSVAALGGCSVAWLERALPALIDADDAAPIDGDGVVHLDVRSDNVCLLDDDRVVLVDWGLLCRGAPGLDAAFFLPTLTVEGGSPPPLDVVDPRLAAVVAGCFADWARLVPVVNAERVREHRLAMFRASLPWAARALDLPPPI